LKPEADPKIIQELLYIRKGSALSVWLDSAREPPELEESVRI